MSTRLTYTEKWEDEWFIELSPESKLFYLFILDRCSNAGIWKQSEKLDKILLGFNYKQCHFDELSSKVIRIKDGIYIVPNFFEKQFKGKKETWRAKLKAIDELVSYGIVVNPDDTLTMGCQPVGDMSSTYPSNSNSNSNNTSNINNIIRAREKIDFDLDALYNNYPRKEGKKKGLDKLGKIIKTQETYEQVQQAIKNYADSVKHSDKQFIKQFSTFVSVWEDYIEPVQVHDDMAELRAKYTGSDFEF